MKKLCEEAKIGRLIKKKIQRKRYADTPRAHSLMAIMMAHVPMVSLQSIEQIISFSFASLLLDCGVEVSNIPYICPSAATLKNIIFEEAANTILLEREVFKASPLSLMCDKGDGSKGRDGENFVKLLAYWDEENKKVRVVSIGIDGAGNSSQEAAKGIDFPSYLLITMISGWYLLVSAQMLVGGEPDHLSMFPCVQEKGLYQCQNIK